MKLWSLFRRDKPGSDSSGGGEAAASEVVDVGPELKDALKALRKATAEPPREAIEWILANRSQSVPALIRVLEREAREPSQEQAPDLIYALYLLAALRATEALPAVLKLCRLPEDVQERVLGDVVPQDMDRVLASVCGRDLAKVKELIEDASVSEWSRAAAVGVISLLVFDGRMDRAEAIEYLGYLLEKGLEREASFVWTAAVAEACLLHPGELLPLIRRAYDEDLADASVQTLKDVLADAKRNRDAHIAANRKESRGLIQDVWQDMKWMGEDGADEDEEGEDEDEAAKLAEELQDDEDDAALAEESFVAEPARTAPKVGRNEPCPCGSGKKYKKCCGA